MTINSRFEYIAVRMILFINTGGNLNSWQRQLLSFWCLRKVWSIETFDLSVGGVRTRVYQVFQLDSCHVLIFVIRIRRLTWQNIDEMCFLFTKSFFINIFLLVVVNFENVVTHGLFCQFLSLVWQFLKRNIPVLIPVIDTCAVAKDLWMMLFQALEFFSNQLLI